MFKFVCVQATVHLTLKKIHDENHTTLKKKPPKNREREKESWGGCGGEENWCRGRPWRKTKSDMETMRLKSTQNKWTKIMFPFYLWTVHILESENTASLWSQSEDVKPSLRHDSAMMGTAIHCCHTLPMCRPSSSKSWQWPEITSWEWAASFLSRPAEISHFQLAHRASENKNPPV